MRFSYGDGTTLEGGGASDGPFRGGGRLGGVDDGTSDIGSHKTGNKTVSDSSYTRKAHLKERWNYCVILEQGYNGMKKRKPIINTDHGYPKDPFYIFPFLVGEMDIY